MINDPNTLRRCPETSTFSLLFAASGKNTTGEDKIKPAVMKGHQCEQEATNVGVIISDLYDITKGWFQCAIWAHWNMEQVQKK